MSEHRLPPQPGDWVMVEQSTWSPVDATRALIGHVVEVEEVGPKFIVVEGGWEFNLSGLSPAEPPQTIEKFGRTYRLDEGPGTAILTPDQIAAQIAEAREQGRNEGVKAEREACLAACEAVEDPIMGWPDGRGRYVAAFGATQSVAAIRARGETA